MDDKLSGIYKELWIEYQNSETKDIGELTYDQLIERIQKWEAIEFEARAKRQKCNAEKRSRDLKREKEGRDKLVFDPHYSPADSPMRPGNGEYKVKEKEPRKTKEQKAKEALADLGLDLGDLLKDVQAKKKAGVSTVNQAPNSGK